MMMSGKRGNIMYKYQIEALRKLIKACDIAFEVEDYIVIKLPIHMVFLATEVDYISFLGFKKEYVKELGVNFIDILWSKTGKSPEDESLVLNQVKDLTFYTEDIDDPEVPEEMEIEDYLVYDNKLYEKTIRRIFDVLLKKVKIHWDYENSERELLTCEDKGLFVLNLSTTIHFN